MNNQTAAVSITAAGVATALIAAFDVPGKLDMRWAIEHVQTAGSSLSVEFVEAGANGTGYFNKLTHVTQEELEVEAGEAPFYYGADQHGRMVILLPIVDGKNIVIFQRYSSADSVWVHNGPVGTDTLFARMGWDGGMSYDQVASAVGGPGNGHLGIQLRKLIESIG